MKQIFSEAVSPISLQTGFCYHTVYVYNENSELHCHDFYEIFLTISDQVIHNINGAKEILSRGTLVFIRKEDNHCYEHTHNKNISFINLSFTEETLTDLFNFLTDGFTSKELLESDSPPSVILDEGDIHWFIKEIEALNASPSSDVSFLRYRYRLFLLKVFTRYFSQYNTSHIPLWLSQLNNEMQKPENFSRGPDHMVEISGRCRAHLGRMVKQYYGKTIPDYINDLRLNYFANTLLTSDTPIIDLCYECGFENVGWAYTLFKKKYGIPPMKYRKKYFHE